MQCHIIKAPLLTCFVIHILLLDEFLKIFVA